MTGGVLESLDGLLHWRSDEGRIPLDRSQPSTWYWISDCDFGRCKPHLSGMRYTGSDDLSEVTCLECLVATWKKGDPRW